MRIRNTAGKAVKKRAAAAEKNVPTKPRAAHPEFLQEAVFLRRERQAGLRIPAFISSGSGSSILG
jgi:hypothetical protein